jgi:ribosomal protein L13
LKVKEVIVIESKQVKVKGKDYLIKNPGARWVIKLDDELKHKGENFGSYDLKDFSDRLLNKAVDGDLPADEEVQEELFNETLKFIGLSIKEETIDGEKIMYFDFEP